MIYNEIVVIFLIDVDFVYPAHFTSAAVYVIRLHTHSQNILNWDGPTRMLSPRIKGMCKLPTQTDRMVSDSDFWSIRVWCRFA